MKMSAPAGFYLLKLTIKALELCEICSKLTIKKLERRK